MSRFNTGNPIGSADPRDRDDNSKNLDLAVNDLVNDQWRDRFSVMRWTWSGMDRAFDFAQDSRQTLFDNAQTQRENDFDDAQEFRSDAFDQDQDDRDLRFNQFLASSGYQSIGDYEPGMVVTEYNQIFRHEGSFFRVKPSVDLPFTASNWEDDSQFFVGLDDAMLRQELNSPSGGDIVNVTTSTGTGQSIADALDERTIVFSSYIDAESAVQGSSTPLFFSIPGLGAYRYDGAKITLQTSYIYPEAIPEVQAWLVRLKEIGAPTPPYDFFKSMQAFVVALKESGIWGKIDALYWLASYEKEAALVNLVSPGAYDGLIDNDNVWNGFIPYTGWKGNGTDSKIKTQLTPANGSTKYGLSDSHILIGCSSHEGSAGYTVGASSSFSRGMRLNRNSNTLTVRANDGTNASVANPLNTPFGLSGWSRTGLSSYRVYRDGFLIKQMDIPATTLSGGEFVIFRSSSSSSVGLQTLTMASFGKGLTDSDNLNFSSAYKKLCEELGINGDGRSVDVDGED